MKKILLKKFRLGDNIINPLTGKSITVGKPAFAKLVDRFGEKTLYNHLIKGEILLKKFRPGDSIINPLTGKPNTVGKPAFAKLVARFGEKTLYKHLIEGEPQDAIEIATKKFKYFDIDDELLSPITGKLIIVGKPTFSKLVKQFGEKALDDYDKNGILNDAIKAAKAEFIKKENVIQNNDNKGILNDSKQEKEIKFELLDHAFKNSDKTYEAKFDLITFTQFETECSEPIQNILIQELNEIKGIKYYIMITVQLSKTSIKKDQCGNIEKDTTIVTPSIYTKTKIALIEGDVDMDQIFLKLLENISLYQKEGSGWRLDGIFDCRINISKYAPLRGSSYIDLPIAIKKKQCCINVKNNDDKCFAWAVLSALHPVDGKNHPDRVSNYIKHYDNYNWTGIKYPAKITDIPHFEKNNSININVFGYDAENQVHPLYITKNKHTKTIDLLYVTNGKLNHYCWIKNFNGLLLKQYNNQNNTKYFCKKCLHGFTTHTLLNKHGDDCTEAVKIELPTEENKWLQFTNINRQLKVPFIIYADFEAITKPINSVSNNPQKSCTEAYQKHEPCGFAYKVVCIDNKYTKPIVLYRGEDCIEKFINSLKEEVKFILNKMIYHPASKIITNEDKVAYKNATNCHICEKQLNGDKVWDHCHITGKYRGAAHNKCNLKYKIPNFIPVVFHNLRGYDSHLLVQHIGKFTDKINVIPNNMEKYMSISLGKLRFIDSFQFMTASLEELVKNTDKFYHTESEIKKNVYLLKQKGMYPYDYMDSWDKFKETALPPKSAFYSILKDSHITSDDYEHAKKVWNKCGIKTMGEYHDLYLKTDVLLLADVFENFRELCLNYYGLDAAHYFTSPGLAWDAALKISKVKLELLTDPDMFLMIEKGIRGGISVISNRYSIANNKYMKNFDKKKPSKYITYLDANNLYGWAMVQPLPTSGFEWIDPKNIDINNIADDDEYGYILEVDLKYPAKLHDLHNDYPLAPESINITNDMLSEYSKVLKQKLDIGNSNVPKLVPNLNNKIKYVVHCRNLKFYLEQGLELAQIHRIIKFKQEPWLKSYIDFNTEKRKQGKTTFEKDFFKLMNNSVFGKTMENIRKRVNIQVVNNKKIRDKLVSKPSFENLKIIDENLVIIKNKQTKLKLLKPIYCGFAILDLSKLLMFDFHYNNIKKQYGNKAKLLFTDTDSLCYEIETEDAYQDMYDKKELYDFSDFPKDNKFYDNSNMKVIGKFKLETSFIIVIEFVGLRSKMYSLKLDNDEQKKRAKGIKKNIVKNVITHNDYKNVVLKGTKKYSEMKTIRSSNHQIYSYSINKVGLCAFDDKRYVTDNGIDTLAHGHYKCKI